MFDKSLVKRSRQVCALVVAVALCVLLVPPIPAQQAHAEVSQADLAAHVVQGLDPANTTVNLFNYSTGKTGAEGTSTGGTDTLGTTGSASPYVNFTTWLTGDDNINKGRLLTFGDGMRHLGYWNQGLVAGYNEGGASDTNPDALANKHPGMQGIVETSLSHEGSPTVSADAVTGYNADPELYSMAVRSSAWSPNEVVYGNAGPLWKTSLANTKSDPNFYPVLAWNVGRAVQAQAVAAS